MGGIVMSKVDDIELFVEVVKAGGLAAAGRVVGLSPASMTARVNQLEKNYNSRLFNRTTRKITLTDAGQKFYQIALRVSADLAEIATTLKQENTELEGRIKITAPSDFGRQYLVPALAKFVKLHPKIEPHLFLSEGIISLVDQGFDLGIRIGNLPSSNIIALPLVENKRLLCASPEYLQSAPVLKQANDLINHQCIVLERLGEPLNEWFFKYKGKIKAIKVVPALIANDGAIIRQWVVDGMGIAMKSFWDIKEDLEQGRLVSLLDDVVQGFQRSDKDNVGLQIIYPQRNFQPKHVAIFIDFFKEYLAGFQAV